ncbi:MAG: ISKra4 family transposase [Ktedonobacteraceae bacterium]
METSQGVKTVLIQQAEAGVRKLLESLQTIEEGDLKGLEQQVLETIFAVGRGWMESILSEPVPQERASSQRIGSCGHPQQLEGYRPKQVLTLLGKVTFRRGYYRCVVAEDPAERPARGAGEADASQEQACAHGEAPADVLWGLQGQRTSAGVQQAVSYLCASSTLEEAAETFSRLLPLQMSARQALNLMQPLGKALQQQEDEQVRALWEQALQARTGGLVDSTSPPDPIDRLYIELDGVLARLRRGSVPMEEQERKRKGDVYREVKVGAVFEATRGPERSGLAPGVFVDQAGHKHYVARRAKAEDFGKLLYALAVKYGLQRAHQLVVLGDGAAWIWRLVAEHFAGAVQIVDIWHAREHVWKVARAVFGANTPEASAWAEHACSLLVEGKIEELVEEIVVLPPVPPEPGTSRSVPEIERDYFISNAARMRYPAFRAQGMHVGSGIAEAACKTVVSTRAKRTGMRWTPEGLDAVLAVRTAVLNDTYDAFCEQHSLLVA